MIYGSSIWLGRRAHACRGCWYLANLRSSNYAPIIVKPHLPQSGKGGDLQRLFDKFPTPGDNFMLQIPCILYRDSKNNENSWTNAPILGPNYADKSLQIPTHCPIWGRWGLTMIGALIALIVANPYQGGGKYSVYYGWCTRPYFPHPHVKGK